jgi:hypothetical protein
VAEPKLLDRMRSLLRTRHCSTRTEDAYVQWASFHSLSWAKASERDGAAEINAFLSYLA